MSADSVAKSLPIFVGSTYEDLRDHRAAVEQALHRLEALVRGMEYFGSRPGSPKEECLAEVRRCRAYIGIFGMRYGSVDPEAGLSLTHLEYLEAQRLSIPTLIYLLDEERHLVLPKFVDRGDGAEKLSSLKSELKRRFTVGFFTSADDLAPQVSQDLPVLLAKLGVDVQPNILAHLVEALPRIDWLSDDDWRFIRGKLGPLAERGVPEPVLRGAVEFLLSQDRLTASYLVAKASNLDIRQAITLSIDIEKILKSIIEDGYSRLAQKQATSPRDDV